jgi:hypothetical protein
MEHQKLWIRWRRISAAARLPHDRLPHHYFAATASPGLALSAARGAHATWGTTPQGHPGSGRRSCANHDRFHWALIPNLVAICRSHSQSPYLSISLTIKCISLKNAHELKNGRRGFLCSVQPTAFRFLLILFITTRDRGASPLLGHAIPRPELAQLDPTKTEWPAQNASTLTD